MLLKLTVYQKKENAKEVVPFVNCDLEPHYGAGQPRLISIFVDGRESGI